MRIAQGACVFPTPISGAEIFELKVTAIRTNPATFLSSTAGGLEATHPITHAV